MFCSIKKNLSILLTLRNTSDPRNYVLVSVHSESDRLTLNIIPTLTHITWIWHQFDCEGIFFLYSLHQLQVQDLDSHPVIVYQEDHYHAQQPRQVIGHRAQYKGPTHLISCKFCQSAFYILSYFFHLITFGMCINRVFLWINCLFLHTFAYLSVFCKSIYLSSQKSLQMQISSSKRIFFLKRIYTY